MIAGITFDNWKLEIFERHLKNKGYTYVNSGQITEGAMMLKVETENLEALAEVVTAANDEAAQIGSLQ